MVLPFRVVVLPAVGSCSLPGPCGVNACCSCISTPDPCPFWTWPITPVGQSMGTTVQTHVRCLALAVVLGGSRRWVRPCSPFVPPSVLDDASLPWGTCCSSIHQEEWVSHPSTNTLLSLASPCCYAGERMLPHSTKEKGEWQDRSHLACASFGANGSHEYTHSSGVDAQERLAK